MMTIPSYDAIVVGAGAMGSAVLLELARRGKRILGIDQYSPGHNLGSSHGQTRIIRTAYYEHPSYVPLLKRAFILWEQLEEETRRQILFRTPCLSLGTPQSEVIRGVTKAAAEHQLAVERLTPSETSRLFPAFSVPEDYVGLVEQEAGYLMAEEAVLTQINHAIRLGAVFQERNRLQSWVPDGKGVVVQTERGACRTDRLILACGPWAGLVLEKLQLPLTVMRQTLHWYGSSNSSLFEPDRFPVFLVDTAAGYFYGIPKVDEQGPKLARHYGSPELPSPGLISREITPSDSVPVDGFKSQFLPRLDGPLHRSEACIYTLTPDRHFIIDRHPENSQVILAAGFSGHGFKFAPVVGEILADLAETDSTRHDISLFRLDRFSRR